VDRKYLLGGLIALAVILAGAVGYSVFFNNSGSIDTDSKLSVQVTSYDRAQGSPKAPLTVVEYAAPSCPHCAYFEMNVFPQFKKNWIDTGRVYYVFRVLPLGPADVAAESIARCLPAEHYFEFIDLLFRNQTKWDPEYQVPDVHAGLVQMGQLAGMTPAQVDTCIGDQKASALTQQIGQDAMTKYNITGTPTFLAGGQMHGPFEDYKEMNAFLITVAKK
jgi:protein-disulfide isomerase